LSVAKREQISNGSAIARNQTVVKISVVRSVEISYMLE